MKHIGKLLFVGATLCLAGCLNVDTAQCRLAGGEHVMITNKGWKLFNWIPLWSGNASDNATCGTAFFRDDVTMEKIQHRFVAYANGREIIDPSWDVTDEVIITVFGIPVPYIITYKEMTISGTMK